MAVQALEAARAGDRGNRLATWAEDARVQKVAYALAGVLVYVAVLRRFFPAPVGVLIQGLVIGGLTALVAFGLALVYRSNRIINFAQGDLGGLPASLAVLCIVGPGVPYFVALPIAVVAALMLGALVEFLFIRRFFEAPRLILTVVTIGVSQLLAVLGIILPRAFDLDSPPQNFPSPFSFQFSIGTVVFQGNEVIAMLAVPVVIAALAAFFRYTDIGIAVRASAERAERAALLGVPVKRIQNYVWIIATVLATLALFLRAGIVGLPIGTVFGPSILVQALAAAVIGRMERLPTIFVAAAVLGITESAVIYNGDKDLLDPLIFVGVLLALLAQRRLVVARGDEAASWQAAREVRPIPRELLRLPEVRYGVRGLKLALVAIMLALPAILPEFQVNLASVVILIAIVGLSLVILTGWAGVVSLGQVAFLGIGAAVGGAITQRWGWDLSLAILVGGLAGAAAAMLIGLPALRIRGLYLAVVTLAFALATSSYLLNTNYVGWLPVGRITRPLLFGTISVESEARFYYLCLAALAIALAAIRGLRNSRTGRVLIAVRENERAVQAYGVNAVAAKLQAFALSGFLAAFAGAIFVHQQRGLDTSPYQVSESFEVFTMVVIGGLGSAPGAILGAVYLRGFEYFASIFPAFLRPYIGLFTSSIGLIIVLQVLPGGLSQILYGLRDRLLRSVAERKGVLVPSMVADMRQPLPGGLPGEEPPPMDTTSTPDAIHIGDELTAALAEASPAATSGTNALPTAPRRGSSRRRTAMEAK